MARAFDARLIDTKSVINAGGWVTYWMCNFITGLKPKYTLRLEDMEAEGFLKNHKPTNFYRVQSDTYNLDEWVRVTSVETKTVYPKKYQSDMDVTVVCHVNLKRAGNNLEVLEAMHE